MVDTLHKLAQIAGSFGEFDEEEELAKTCLALSRQLGRPDSIAYALDVLGWATLCLGEYKKSEECYRESLTIFEAINSRLGIALALGGIGSVFWAIGGERLTEAAHYFEKSMLLCREIGHQHHLSSRLWYLGQVANDLEQYDVAQRYAAEGLQIAKDIGSQVFMSYNLCCLGETACAIDELESSWAYLIDALKIAAEAHQLQPLHMALIHLAHLKVKVLTRVDEKQTARLRFSEDILLSQKIESLELLQFVINHSGCWLVFKERAEKLRRQISDDLPIDMAQIAKQQQIYQSLDEAIARLLSEKFHAIQTENVRY